MNIIRQLIYFLFGLEGYLKLVSSIYIFLVRNTLLKKKYPELFYLNEIIRPGNVCIDIGANLGYYSTYLSRLCGVDGKVIAVEPVPLFQKILKRNLKMNNSTNVEVSPFALGQKEEVVKMGMPKVDGIIHHGMTKIISDNEDKYAEYFEVEMKIPDILFANLEKLDFIKCDVEGYEQYVFSNMVETIKKHKPIIQSELGGKQNREIVFNVLTRLGYQCNTLKNSALSPVSFTDLHAYSSDFYFILKND